MINPKSNCVWTKGIENLYLPIRHGEGKLSGDNEIMARLLMRNQAVVQYTDPKNRRADHGESA